MAAETLSNLSGALAQTFAPDLVRVWNRDALLLKTISWKAGGGQGSGLNVAWDVETSGSTAAAMQEGSDVGAGEFDFDPTIPATLPWGMYRAAFSLTNHEINVASANIGNASALGDIVGERFLGKMAKLVDLMEADVFTGTGTAANTFPNIVGFDTAVAATGTYANISKSTYPEWAGNVLSNGGVARPLTMDLLAKAEQAMFIASGRSPEALVVSPGVYTKYEGLFESQSRVVNDTSSPMKSFYGSFTDGLYWRGRPVVRARKAPSGTCRMVTFSELEGRYLPWVGVPYGTEVADRPMASSHGDDASPIGLACHVYQLAKTGSSAKFAMEVTLQLKVKRPGQHALISDVSEV
jgi:hypothetical protein